MPSLPKTKDKRRQKRILAAAQRQTDQLGLGTKFSFRGDGVMLIDGRTQEEIDTHYEATIKAFFEENKRYLDPSMPVRTFEDGTPAPVIVLPPPTKPGIVNTEPIVLKFELRRRN